MIVYHVTYLTRLRQIAQEGLRPTRRKGIGGESFNLHRRGAIFLTAVGGLRGWYNLAVEWGDQRGKGSPPVVLRMQKPTTCEEDIHGEHVGGVAFKCSTTIPPAKIKVYTGLKWVAVTTFANASLRELKRVFDTEAAISPYWGIMEASESPLFPRVTKPKQQKKKAKPKKRTGARSLVARALR